MKRYELLKQAINNHGYCSVDKQNMDIIEEEIRADEKAKVLDEIENGLLRLMLISEERKDINFARGDWDLVYTVLADYVEISDLRIEEKWQQLKGEEYENRYKRET